jgi:hypothetical protein
MKKIFIVLATGLFAVACNNNNQTADIPKNADLLLDNLKGKIQHREDAPYKVDSTGKIEELDTCCTEIQDYDEKGYLTKYFTRDNKGTVKDEYSYTRYDNGLLKEWVIMNGGKKKSSLSIELNKDGNYGDAQNYDSNGKMDAYYTDVKSNEYGRVTSWKKYKPDSTLLSTWSAVFDKYIWVSSTTTDSTGKVNGTYKAKNDEKGNIIEFSSTEVKNDSTTNKIFTYKYDSFDDQGNWIQQSEFDDKGKPTKIVKRTIVYYKVD